MKHAVCTLCLATVLTLTSCSHNLTGHYTGYVSLVFGLLHARTHVGRRDGDTALSRWVAYPLQVARHGDRLVLSDARGDALTFHVLHEGDTLHCALCTTLQLPQRWERQRRERLPVEIVHPPRGRRAGQAEALDASE